MISFDRSVIEYFDELIFELYSKDYFSTSENAENYVDAILDFIESSIHTFPSKKTPVKLKSFGTYYIFYKSNWFKLFHLFSS